MARSWRCSVIVAVLLLVIVALLWKFMIAGSTVAGNSVDERTVIVLTDEEKAIVLEEMRAFLSALQIMSSELANDNLPAVEQASRRMGVSEMAAVPVSLMGKLPMEFKQLGRSVHVQFDQIAMDAAELGDAQHTLSQMGDIMTKCVVCHSSYRLISEQHK